VGYALRMLFGIYLSAIGTFAQCYLIILYFDHASFSFGDVPEFSASLMSATYFSVATITSTGYGDIHPKSEVAMAVVTAEMLIGYILTVVFFSTIAALAFRSKTP
jgi:voltage-gated potassium channel Kch